ncbi:MAG: HD-GYP domain-containing protein (c-di-GMP phosphodiesterase class II) [Desulforhopalus sp.]|jgi:HD-GYP domain-containing protein (c-di-GMP phosphodiesterase class II)
MNMKIRRYPFYIGITSLVVIIVITLTALFLWISHRESRTAAILVADQLFSEINEKTLERYERTLESVAVLAGSAARMSDMAGLVSADKMSHPGMDLMFNALDFYKYIFSTYIGFDNGNFIQLIALRDKQELRDLFDAPAGTMYTLRTISKDSQGVRKQHWRFLDQEHKVIGKGKKLDPDYDPRLRSWYSRAKLEGTTSFTEPYVFSSTKLPGITCAKKMRDDSGIFGVDITLEQFSLSLKKQKVSDNGMLFFFDPKGYIIVHPQEDTIKVGEDNSLSFLHSDDSVDPLVRAIVTDYRANPETMQNRTREMMVNGTAYLVRSTGLKAELKIDQILASVAPVSDFTGYIQRMQKRVFLFSVFVLLVVLPLALLVSRKISGSLIRLEQESRKIQQSDFSESEPFDSNIKEIHSLIKTFVLMKSTIRDYTARLIRAKEEIEELFTAITELLAGAIDAKSPYTGGHCKRVPVVAKMLADAAHASKDTPFVGFNMDTKEKRREFEVAAWLHDCGKVTTPEYVVDKATKLETIYNRIHEVRMRFEILLRDAEIVFLHQRLDGNDDISQLQAELEERKQQIVDDFAFVADCNVGGEFMAEEKIERLKLISKQTWKRHMDDRLGLSQDEASMKNILPAQPLPVVEHVLADKLEQIIPRGNPDPFEGNTYGFNMTLPENGYNLGELYNLSIQKGTLSPEDRFKINEHIIQTIIMLSRLPFPESMKNVVEIAGAHHETMIGTGYPKGLKKEEMSIPARIMAIADIFEALTAADRPYKKPKTLSEALRIMSFMRNDKHIDAELFDLFLQSRVYLNYAEQFLDPSQIDEVDVDQYL